jgi:hypothetical protein
LPLKRTFGVWFIAKHEFSNEWHRFLHRRTPTTSRCSDSTLSREVPVPVEGDENVKVKAVELFLKLAKEKYEEKYRAGKTSSCS